MAGHRLIIHEKADGRVAVAIKRAAQDIAEYAPDADFQSPLGAAELEDLRWYLEDYLSQPYAVWEGRGHDIQERLTKWGHALFEALFGENSPARDLYLRFSERPCDLRIVSASAAFLSLPWELLRDPQGPVPLALDLRTVDRTLGVAGSAADVPPGDILRVLVVISRPDGLQDVGYQMVARHLLQRLDAVRGKVELMVLRPPTLEALKTVVEEARDDGAPFHVLHFDGHGTAQHAACLAFEAEGGGTDLVPAEEFAQVVRSGRVPVVVLNACQSGMLSENLIDAAVATKLLESGVASVVAMAYSVYVVAAAEFMTEFYEALFSGKSVSESVTAGRQRLFRRKERPSPRGPLPLEDWIVPVHYMRSQIEFTALKRPRKRKMPSLDELLEQRRPSRADAAGAKAANDELAPVGRFVGRDAAIYTLELALRWQHVVVVHGPAGTGKTELAKALGRWWRDTGGVEQPDWVFFHSFEPGIASFGVDGVVTAIGLQIFGPDFAARTQNSTQREELVLRILGERRMLLVWDNFETVRDLPDASGVTQPLDPDEQARMKAFVDALIKSDGSGLIITSRTPEIWLGDVRRLPLGGLQPFEVVEMVDDLLQPYPTARMRRQDRSFADLLEWIGGHPLSLRLLLPHLEQVTASHILQSLQGKTLELPPGFIGEGRTQGLGASIKYSIDHIDAELRGRIAILGLLEGVVDADVLSLASGVRGIPQRFMGGDSESWGEDLEQLSSIGLLTSLGGGMYEMHPALPVYLMTEWHAGAGEQFEAEKTAAEQGLLLAYAQLSIWARDQLVGGSAQAALAVLDAHRRMLGRLLAQALERDKFQEAQAIFQTMSDYYRIRGHNAEAMSWAARCRAVTSANPGEATHFDSERGRLWLFATGVEASRKMEAGDLDSAYKTYEEVRIQLEGSDSVDTKRRLAVTYHQLGLIDQQRSRMDEADRWYRLSLALEEEADNKPGMASSYHHLGTLEHARGDLDLAEIWYLKSLQIEQQLHNQPGMVGSYQALGGVELNRGKLQAAAEMFQKSLDIAITLNNRPNLAIIYNYLGRVFQLGEKYPEATQWYLKSLQIKLELGSKPAIADTYRELGLMAARQDDVEGAFAWLVQSIILFEGEMNSAVEKSAKLLKSIVAKLGIEPLERSWRRCTDQALPADLRAFLTGDGEIS